MSSEIVGIEIGVIRIASSTLNRNYASELAEYYVQVAERILPQVSGRPLTW